MDNKELLIIFVKWPEKGLVKSRLAGVLDEEIVAGLYRCFVEDILSTVKATGRRPCIAFYPADALKKVRAWIGDDYEYLAQEGNDIGSKMENAFLSAFANGVARVVLIGSDFPDLPSGIITEAFHYLKSSDAVIGPAGDGGYYLIGFGRERFLPLIFKDIPWSTPEVFEKTMEILSVNKYKVHILPPWRDIDRPEDLADLIKRSRASHFAQSKTMKLLMGCDFFSE